MKMFSHSLLICVVFAAFIFSATCADDVEVQRQWLQDKSKEDNVESLPSGLMYKVIKSGPADGPSPSISTPCSCHYAGRLIDGTEFDSSYKRGQPTTFAPNQVIKGWTEAMQLMHEGDHWELYVPSELAYGKNSRGRFIKPHSVLVFDLEIIKVNIGRDDL